jgi:hypothetical protein
MSPTLLVVAAWIAGVPWGSLSTEFGHEVGPLPPALEPSAVGLAPDTVYAGERVRLALGAATDLDLRVTCEALGWDALPLAAEPVTGEPHALLTVPADALPGIYALELHAAADGEDGILAWLDLVVLADG